MTVALRGPTNAFELQKFKSAYQIKNKINFQVENSLFDMIDYVHWLRPCLCEQRQNLQLDWFIAMKKKH